MKELRRPDDVWSCPCCSVLEGKLAEARSKKDTLKARAASAKTSKQVQEMMGSLNTSNAVVAFSKMEKVRDSVWVYGGDVWGGGIRGLGGFGQPQYQQCSCGIRQDGEGERAVSECVLGFLREGEGPGWGQGKQTCLGAESARL